MPNPKIGDSSTFSNLIGQIKTRLNDYQTKNLSTPIVVAGESKDTVESALSAINNNASGGSFYKDFKSNSQLGLTNFYGKNVQHDGNITYHSSGKYQYVLNRNTATWEAKTQLGLTQPSRVYIQSDGDNIYYSQGTNHYILDRETSTQESKTQTGLTNFNGNDIQTDGDNIYYDNNNNHYVLDKDTSTQSTNTQNGITYLYGQYIWYDGDNIYYSYQTQNILNKETSTQSTKTWTNNLGSGVNLYGNYIQTDGVDVYFSSGTGVNGVQGKLDRETSTWNLLNRLSEVRPLAEDIWQDNGNIYWSTNGANAVFTEIPVEDLINVPNGLAGLNSNGRIPINQTNYVTVGQKSGSTLGSNATAEGYITVASGSYAHAEGSSTTASGAYSHSEGNATLASAQGAHAEGASTIASHSYAHASGYQTKTGKNSQSVVGTFNKGSADTLFEVGNGTHTSTDRHNAFEVKDKNGSIKIGDTLISTIPTGARGNGSQTTYQPNTTSSTSHQDYTGYWVKFNVDSTTMKEGLVPQTFEGITVDATTTTADGTNEDTVKVVVYSNLLTAGGIVVDGEVIDGDGNALSDIATLSGYVAGISDCIPTNASSSNKFATANDLNNKVSKSGDTIDGDLTIKGSIEIWTAGSVYYAVDDAEHHDVRFHSFSKGASGEDNVGAYIGTYDTEWSLYDYDFNRFDSPSYSSPGRYIKIVIYDYRGQVRGDEIYSFIIDSENLPTTTESNPISVPIPADIYAVEVMPIDINLSTIINTSGITTTGEITDGDGNVLSNKLNSSDISAWAKASTKPSYGINEITGITITSTDPGAGSALTTGNIVFVYNA